MIVHLDPLEYDIWTSLCVIAKRDDQGNLRVGCPDDENTLFENWASNSLECTPDQYRECFDRFVNAGIIGTVGKAEKVGKTIYVFHIEPDNILAFPIWRHFGTWLDPKIYDALEAVQKRFSARFGGKVLCSEVAGFISELLSKEDCSGKGAGLFEHIMGRDGPGAECDTVWSSSRLIAGENRLILCHPDFTGYTFTRSHQNPWDRTFRPVPNFKTIDLSDATRAKYGWRTPMCPKPAVASRNPPERAVGLASVAATEGAIWSYDDPKRYLRGCDAHTIEEIRERASAIVVAVGAEQSRRKTLRTLTEQYAEMLERERALREERERLETEIARLES